MKWAGLLLFATLSASASCPLPNSALQQDGVQLSWQLDRVPSITLSQHFALRVQVCPKDAVLTRVDATMPEHKHGMNYRPSIQSTGEGWWQVEGLLFHMPGKWSLRFDIASAGKITSLHDPITLP